MVTKLYHRGHGIKGALWNSRFSSAYVQTGHASRILSAWLDHAAVRDGETQRADDDKFSTFGRAVSGDKRARAMIEKLYGPDDGSASWRQIATNPAPSAHAAATPSPARTIPTCGRSAKKLTCKKSNCDERIECTLEVGWRF